VAGVRVGHATLVAGCHRLNGNGGQAGGRLTVPLEMLAGERSDPLFYAVIEATEEAIVNAMVAAETMTGRGGATAHRLDHDLLRGIMGRYRPGPGR
jgi:L-aminopeptidase/D-esterase-like protein